MSEIEAESGDDAMRPAPTITSSHAPGREPRSPALDKIVEIKFGSHLYGTSTPASDLDIKAVYLPQGRDILLGRVKPVIHNGRAKAFKERNTSDDVDEEIYSLQKFLMLAAEGQTVAMDMIFAPKWAQMYTCWQWDAVLDLRPRLLTRKCASFIGYCRTQANKYGIKGSRVAAARVALDRLVSGMARFGTVAKLSEMDSELDRIAAENEHITLLDIPAPGDRMVRHLEVCGRKMPYTASIKNAAGIVQKLVDEYGQRALQAERSEGVDWKALSHAVRVGVCAVELLTDHTVTFPLKNRDRVLAIKTGQVSYQEVATEIDDLLVKVEEASERSTLPDQPDYAAIDDLVAGLYRGKARSS